MEILKKTIIFSICLAIFLGIAPVFAIDAPKPPEIPCGTLDSPSRFTDLPCIRDQSSTGAIQGHVYNSFGVTFLRTFLGLAGITAVIFIIVGGLQMHLAFGNDEAIGKAKKTIIWAVFGLVICILSVAIVQIVSKLPLVPTPPSR